MPRDILQPLRFPAIPAPSAPASGVLLHARARTRTLQEFIDEYGIAAPYAPAPWIEQPTIWQPSFSGTDMQFQGIYAVNVFGNTRSAEAVAVTNARTRLRRLRCTSGTSLYASSGWYGYDAPFWRGNAANLGGFFVCHTWGTPTIGTDEGEQVGLTGNGNISAFGLDDFTEYVAFGIQGNGTDSNVQVACCNGSTRTKVDLGSSFARSTTDAYRGILFAPPNGSAVHYHITNLASGAVASGSLTTNLPAATTLMRPVAKHVVSANSTPVSIDYSYGYFAFPRSGDVV